MIKNVCILVFSLSCALGAFAQTDTSRNMVKYTKDFKFKDGIFMNFDEFKNNAPSVTRFELVKDKSSGSDADIYLKYNRPDTSGNKKKKESEQCFGFSKNGVLYFSNGNNGFYRMFIVGALSHFLLTEISNAVDYGYYGYTASINMSTPVTTESVLNFETGIYFDFTYRNFKDFLKQHDQDLLAELEKSKNKKDMIHYFLLKYNEKHPIYFPVN